MERLAVALGIDLARLTREGAVSPFEIDIMMSHCEMCDEPEDCARRLAAGKRMAEPPHYCPNRKLLVFLKEHGQDLTRES